MDYKSNRKYERVIFKQYVRISDIVDKTICFGNTLNISENGICILCNTHFEKDDLCKLTFNLECDNKRIIIFSSAIVIYQYLNEDTFRTGLKFEDSEASKKIKDWINGMQLDTQ